ncbi:MAG TPA: response regulator [Nitrososphaeraceae archaeon]|nr:response regulator [Nitrososphaeraceae archaeon]
MASVSHSNIVIGEEVCFFRSQNCCVCFVDMVNSTEVTADINEPEKIRNYYGIFLNTMAAIARNYRAKIIKNAGDCLIFYFPETIDSTNESAFRDVLECCITMISARCTINTKLYQEKLPSVSYRISANYGRVEVARSSTSQSDDLFGSTMNMCAKINSKALPNAIVIGGDLYQIVKSFSSSFDNNYYFEGVDEYLSTDFNKDNNHHHPYPVYSLSIKNNSGSSNNYGKALNLLLKPTSKKTAGEEVSVKKQPQQQRKYSANIMLVDDEPDTLFTYKEFLISEGYDVEAFTDSRKASEHFAEMNSSSYYNLVVMDMRMPGLNGLQLYYRLTAMNKAIKVLFVSALDAIEELVSVLPSVNYNNIIRKPVEKEYFINKIRSVLLLPS